MTDQIRTVMLENLEPRMVCFNLDHDHALERVFPRVVELNNGKQHGEMATLSLPDSLTFLAKERKSVPASVLQCEEIKNALLPPDGSKPRLSQRGDVVVHDVIDASDAPDADVSAPPAPPADVVNSGSKRQRDAARSVLGTTASVDEPNKG